MIAGLDSASVPTAAQLDAAKRHGVRIWSGYLATKPHVNLLHPWHREDFERVKAAGLVCLAFCSGKDDPVACKNLASSLGVTLCLDVEPQIRPDGPWVQEWLDKSGAGLYGNAPVFRGRRAPFYVLAAYPGHDPQRTWTTDPNHPRPTGPCAWQWQGTHTEFGCGVDRGWYEEFFVGGHTIGNHWTSLGGSFDQDPAVAQNQDGRLELFALGAGGHLFDIAQSAPNGSWWSGWVDLGPPPAPGTAGRLAVGRNLDGRLEIFLRGSDAQVYHRWQQGPGGAITAAWASLGGSFAHDPVVAQNLDGALQLFVLGDGGHLFGLAQNAPNGTWSSSWADHGPPPTAGLAGRLVVARNLDGRVELFARSADGQVHHRFQQTAGGALSPAWESLGGSFEVDPVAAQNQDGRLELLVLGTGGHLFALPQSAANGIWPARWADLGPPPAGGAPGGLAVSRNLDGRLEVFLRGSDKAIHHRWQQGAGGALTPAWKSLGGVFSGGPVVGRNQNGRLEVFVLGTDRGVHHDWQVAANSSWA